MRLFLGTPWVRVWNQDVAESLCRCCSGLIVASWWAVEGVVLRWRPGKCRKRDQPCNELVAINVFSSQAVNRNTKHIFNKHTLLTIISSLVFSKLFYCSNVWPSTSKGNITKLQSIQNFACRIVCGACKYDHATPVLKLHGGAKIWILFSSGKTMIYERAQRVSKSFDSCWL